MSRYIDAELAVKHIEEMTLEHERMQSNFSANWMIDFLEAFPTADVEPVRHGRWIEQTHEWDFPPFHYTDYKCSLCGIREQAKRNYCPDCGAKMDEEENE